MSPTLGNVSVWKYFDITTEAKISKNKNVYTPGSMSHCWHYAPLTRASVFDFLPFIVIFVCKTVILLHFKCKFHAYHIRLHKTCAAWNARTHKYAMKWLHMHLSVIIRTKVTKLWWNHAGFSCHAYSLTLTVYIQIQVGSSWKGTLRAATALPGSSCWSSCCVTLNVLSQLYSNLQ